MISAEDLVALLKQKKLTFSCAESFTGGTLASKIISVSGASKVFSEGIVAYSNAAKQRRLKVQETTLDHFKPVSEKTAEEMLMGIEEFCDVAVSTTGIAGPNSDESGFPVGLCFIGISVKGNRKVYKFNFKGDRNAVIEQGSSKAIELTYKTLKGEK